jgi:hypothetical protein
VPGWIWPGYWGYPYAGYYGYPYTGYDDDSTDPSSYAAPAYDTQPMEPDDSSRNPYYAYAVPPNPPSAQSAPPQNENAVTVVFKDGRPSEQIHNYALTRSTLFVLDEHHRDIPVDEIDLNATKQVNRDAGVEFQLPVALR